MATGPSVPVTPVAGPAAAVLLVSGGDATAIAGSALAESLTGRVVDQAGNGVAGVTFQFVASGGSSTPAVAVSGPNGIVRTLWTLGPSAGP